MEAVAIMAENGESEVRKRKKKKRHRPPGTVQPINSNKGKPSESLEMLGNHDSNSHMYHTKEVSPELEVNVTGTQVSVAAEGGMNDEEQSISPVWLPQQPQESDTVNVAAVENAHISRNVQDEYNTKLPLRTRETQPSIMSSKLDQDDYQDLNVQMLDQELKAALNSPESDETTCTLPNSNNGNLIKSDEEEGMIKSEDSQVISNQDNVLQVGRQELAKAGMEKENLIEKTDQRVKEISGGRPTARWKKLQNTLKATNEVQRPAGREFKRKSSGMNRQDSFLQRFSTRQRETDENEDEEEGQSKTQNKKNKRKWTFVVNPDGDTMFYWLGVQALCALYNLWTLIAREAFPDIQTGSPLAWFILDGFMDFMYLTDIAFQFRTGYLEQGLIVYDSKQLALHYVKSHYFKIDILALTPLDLLQLTTGIHPMWRFPRFFKVYRVYQFYYMAESRTIYPNFWRVMNLIHILLLGSHWFAAFYFLISKSENFPANDWSYPPLQGEYASVTRMYLKSLYWSTLTLTTIGDLPPPKNNWEYVFTILSYLIGVFVFATIVGQVGNVIANRNASRLEFERLLDGAKAYMRNHNVPRDMQTRVQRWYDYAWSRGRISGGGDINSLGLLPDKLKTELALHVNLETLRKVTIFQECEPEFLHDLVLKMKAYIFTPGDLICRKGEVAREMFIIADGVLEVLSESGEVVTQMVSGDFFGEIGILNLDGGVNRRTADVRSVGYSELFVLSREDVLSALQDHPEAEALLTESAKRRLNEIMAKNKMSSCAPDNQEQAEEETDCSAHPVTTQPPSLVANLLGVYSLPPSQKGSMASLRSHSCDCVLSYRDNTPGGSGGVDLQNLKSFDKSNLNQPQPSGPESTGLSTTPAPLSSEAIPKVVVQGNEIGSQDPSSLLTGLKSVLMQNMDAVMNQFQDKVNMLEDDNRKKAEVIKELESKVKSLQRALLWKSSKETGMTVPSVDI